jgi:hypothetical protein
LDRYVRQRTLAAVGDAGQQRIEAATYATRGTGDAATVERSYLERAGARHFSPAPELPPFVHAAVFVSPAARDYAEGAWRALAQLRRALEQA